MKLAKHEQRDRPLAPLRAFSPVGHLSRLRNKIDRLFEEPFGGWPMMDREFFQGSNPVVDVYEHKDNVVVKAELPGMKKEDIDVSLSGDTLSITGERKEESEQKDGEGYCCERYFGRFQRTVSLPVSVESDKIRADYKDGILTITCPKTEEAKRKHIDVKVE